MSAWVAVSEVDFEGCPGGCPAAVVLPLRVGLDEREVDQLGRGLLVGEVPAGLDRFADLAVQALDRVGRVDRSTELLGQRQERRHVLKGRSPCLYARRVS